MLGSGDSGSVPSGETPNTEFEVEQNVGLASQDHQIATIEINHAGGHAVRTENLELYYEDTPIPEPEWWGWTTVLDDQSDWESVGDRWTEGEYISVTSDSPGDHGITVDLSGVFELVWTSPDTGEETPLLTYEPFDCSRDVTATEEGCPTTTAGDS